MIAGDACRQAGIAVRAARADASSLFYGTSRARVKGMGIEYVDFREYSFSDDIRHVDWRLSARTLRPDGEMRLMVKEYEAERRVHVVFAVDISPSMFFGSKIWSLIYAASFTAQLASRLEDEVTLVVISDPPRIWWRVDPGLIPSLLRTLICREGSSGEASLASLASSIRRMRPEPRLMLFTDYDHRPEEAFMLAKTLRTLGSQGQAVLVYDRYEVEPPLDENPLLALRSMEGGPPIYGFMESLYESVRKHIGSVKAALASGRMGVLSIGGKKVAVRAKAGLLSAYLRLRARFRLY